MFRHQKVQVPWPGVTGQPIGWDVIHVVNVIDKETWDEQIIRQPDEPIRDFTDWEYLCVPQIYRIENHGEVADTIYELGKFLGFVEMMEDEKNWHINVLEDGDVEEHVMLEKKKLWGYLKQMTGIR